MRPSPTLRWSLATAGVVTTLIVLGFASLFSDEPMYLKSRGSYFQTCQDADDRYDISVKSADGGKTADVTYRGQTERVSFVNGFLFTDRYRGDAVSMTIDPEIAVTGFHDDPDYRCDL